MKRLFATLIAVLLCFFAAEAQPFMRKAPTGRVHHTQRLPGVNEHRLARLEKMREANIARRHQVGPMRVKTQPETQRGLVLLVEFSDVKLKSNAPSAWNNRFNQQGFSLSNHVGSVRDYFIEQSYGMLAIDFDVIGPLTLSKTRTYYGTSPNSQLSDRAPEMVIEALKLTDSQVNFADYDWDGDGEVDQVYVIFAGQTKSQTQGYIWPHEWNLSAGKAYGSGSGRQRMDNVYIDTYAVSNEMASSTLIEGIGTACHEFSHCLGYPDFYDTDYTGGTAGQNWDVLDGGSYNGPQHIGEVPSPYTAYERWCAGWIDLIPLTDACKVTDMPAINEEGVAYVITNTGNSNEYYILENRQQITFGTGNRGHGLMVWHIDYNAAAWGTNKVNAIKSHQRMTFLPADGKVGNLFGSESSGYGYDITASDEAGDPYPGRKKVTSVQQLTWFTSEKNGTKTHQNLIHNITETADGKISFIYGDYVALPTPEVAAPTNIMWNGFIANWQPVDGAASYTLEVRTLNGADAPATILEENFSGFQSAGANTNISNSVLSKYTQTSGWSVSYLYGTGEASARIGSSGTVGYLMTPALENKPGKLTVQFDASYYSTDGSSIVVSLLSDDQTIATQTVPLTADRTTYSLTFEDVPTGCHVKFATVVRMKRVNLYNVNIMDMSGVGFDNMSYKGLTSTSFPVEIPETDMCYYRVQAVCADGTSKWSDWMAVDIASVIGETPVSPIAIDKVNNVYDLQGRRLPSVPQRGIYIRNGRVFMAH